MQLCAKGLLTPAAFQLGIVPVLILEALPPILKLMEAVGTCGDVVINFFVVIEPASSFLLSISVHF